MNTQTLQLWLATFQLALRNLLLHKLRSFLTMLGTVLGVASVIAMLAIGEGSKRDAIERIRQLGARNVIIRTIKPEMESMPTPASNNTGRGSNQQQSRIVEYGLTYRDFERLLGTLPNVEQAVPLTLNRRLINRGRRRMPNSRVLGTTPALQSVKNLRLSRGRFLSPSDLRDTANVVVLGAGAARQLFSYEDPLGETVLVGQGAYRVVGVLGRQATGNTQPGEVGQDDLNNDLYVPLTAAQRRIGITQQVGAGEFERVQLSEITLTIAHEDLVMPTAAMARKLLGMSHKKKDDFEVQTPLKLLQQARREKRMWNLVLGSIASISLLVGGIGIMNIMLATVTERTREIGIRRALGATRNHITLQFLIESTTLSAIGGVLGVFVGVAIPVFVTLASEIKTSISGWSVLVAFLISVGIGIGFGVYPARRAAFMDPIEALRHQ